MYLFHYAVLLGTATKFALSPNASLRGSANRVGAEILFTVRSRIRLRPIEIYDSPGRQANRGGKFTPIFPGKPPPGFFPGFFGGRPDSVGCAGSVPCTRDWWMRNSVCRKQNLHTLQLPILRAVCERIRQAQRPRRRRITSSKARGLGAAGAVPEDQA